MLVHTLTARAQMLLWASAQRWHRDLAEERGQGTVEYVGLTRTIGVRLVSSSHA